MRLLAGDVGGTKTLLALYEERGGDCIELARERYDSAAFDGLEAVLERFAASHHERPDAAAFAIAGPVLDQICDTTNLPWHVDARSLAARLGAPAELLNDFSAVAHGIDLLEPGDLHVLQAGAIDPAGPRVILGAGTGLGEAVAVPTRDGLRVLESEGGHADFPARDAFELQLVEALTKHRGRVSVEDVVSGPGLARLYHFVVDHGLAPEQPDTRAAIDAGDASAIIAERAASGRDPACARAVQAFVSAYGAEAGNLALKVVPTGGLYVAGGIAPKLLGALASGGFLEAFLAKAPMQRLLSRVQVAVVTRADVGLLGARARAAVLS